MNMNTLTLLQMRLRRFLWVLQDEGPFSRLVYVRLFEILSKLKPESVVMVLGSVDWRIPCMMSKLNLKKVVTFVYGDYIDGSIRRMLGGGAKFGNQGKVSLVLREQEPNFVKLWSFPVDVLIISDRDFLTDGETKKMVSSLKRGGTIVVRDAKKFAEDNGIFLTSIPYNEVIDGTFIGKRR